MHGEENIRSFLKNWLDQEGDLTPEKAQDLWGEQFDPGQFLMVWDHLIKRQLIKPHSNNELFNLTPDAVQWVNKSTVRHSIEDGKKAVELLMDKVHAWNSVAQTNHWPTVSYVAVWGSLSRATSEDCGDADVALVWRSPMDQALEIIPSSFSSRLGLKRLEDRLRSHSSMDIEETVEDWLSQIPLISLSGVDQWDDLSVLDPHFSASCVWKDNLWGTPHEKTGIKDWECDMLRHICAVWPPKSHTLPRSHRPMV